MNAQMPEPNSEELRAAFDASKGIRVPPVPEMLLALRKELSAPEPNAQRIAALVAKDQAVAGQVLKTVNAPAYGQRQPVPSIAQAVILLGLTEVHNLVLAALAQQQLQVRSTLGRQIWHDSVETARAAMHIAARVDGVAADESYLLGLLHDCGALLMAEKWPDYASAWDLRGSYPIGMIENEKRRFGTHHAVIGYLFARHWKLNADMCRAIYAHHQPLCASFDDHHLRALVANLKLADMLVSAARMGAEDSLERVQYLAGACHELMIDAEVLEELRRDAALGFE
jgi:HD-like signal output (HDOD) protein